MFEQQFRQFVATHDLLPVEATVLVAVSGGLDSVVLLHLLERYYRHQSGTLVVAHLDHSLCLESREAATLVETLCRQLDLPLVAETVTIERQGAGLEAAARDRRYAFLRCVADQHHCSLICLAHHQDDQAETLLYRLTRGTGPGGLSAMRPRQERLIRPLLFAGRTEIRAWAQAQQLQWWEDPGNAVLAYDRNRLRHRVLPELQKINPRVADALGQLAEQSAVEETFWQQQVDACLPLLTEEVEDGHMLDLNGFQRQHPALQPRLLRRLIDSLRGSLSGIGRRHVQAVLVMIHAERPQAELQLPGLWVARRYDRLWLRQKAPLSPAPYHFQLQANQRVELPNGQSLDAELVHERGIEDRWMCEADPAVLTLGVVVRTWQPGDRISLPNQTGRTKLQDLFTDLKLTLEQRAHQPVVVAGKEVLWLPGLRRSSLAPSPGLEKPCLRMRFHT